MSWFGNHSSSTQTDVEAELTRLRRALEELSREHLRGQHGLSGLRSRAEALWQDRDWHARDLLDSTRAAGRAAQDCARQHPLAGVALLLGIGAAIGCYAYCRRHPEHYSNWRRNI
ncbi:hypothetical protein [Pseudomonas flexibilis]|jgi:ElaB/YqjD/DUF883 family membrane-anchored ribosome-binding protein|uniref:Membrane-anchored ribosome-binding protein, inhibits growth in stationary phase, ElaB/YqjD/DUF883 family n=1 Tax=Pseudomonas flexibilis TaxID=706570 RepID=A0A1N6RWT3_9PSED|nr:hypothetical protein [Pseudomonas flexibilis]KHL68293.1 hypothetical protein SF06_29460 [Pseudomonas flexibilis]SCY26754.1 Membrane-anchored ribosome-binding protein, inhibits growth in stationary phase, ElaB/YqjD/DUF883 family [Pseudomonas flexibilis]SIQ33304.1 Membrane-anchored ribosome-binding protein, inhibits growth in stationary phase, ElaB/YqjD/DUF883 family [Pseudomonas flexibilis]